MVGSRFERFSALLGSFSPVVFSLFGVFFLASASLSAEAQSLAMRRGRSRDGIGQYALAPRVGASMSLLWYSDFEYSRQVGYGYHLGGQGLIRLRPDMEIDMALLFLWKGGGTTQGVLLDGQAARVKTSTRIFYVNMPAFFNYVYRINADVSVLGGAGLALNVGFGGNVRVSVGDEKMGTDLRFGFKETHHYMPFDIGVPIQFGVRFFQYMQCTLWYEIDFLNINRYSDAKPPKMSSTDLFIYDNSAQLLHSFGPQRSMAFGVSFSYFFHL